MRVLLLMRGAPGCGKSTFIDKNGLRPYTLSADEIRLQCQSPQQSVDGTEEVSMSNEKTTWGILFKLLEVRMQNGEFTVIDATNSKTIEMNRYKQMCDTYRYRMYCIDFTDLSIEECKRRNAGRIPLKQVPEEVIDKMYARFKNQKIPSGIKVLKPDELDKIWMKKIDLSNYEKIVHIGDIHGCYTALMEYFKNGLNNNYFYIFCGDLIDRGIENVEVLKWFLQIINKPNVLLLEGNHERWIWIYANGGIGHSKEFELVTKKQLDEAHFDLKDLRQLYRRVGQCAWYAYDEKEVVVTHAGISTMPENMTLLSTQQMIKGVGNYNDFETIADTWMNTTPNNFYQIYGHRNTKNADIRIKDRVFNLEGQVEFGGYLRIVELDHNGFNEVLIKNNVFKDPEVVSSEKLMQSSSITDVVLEMRKNKYIQEKTFGKISSFNFTKSAFYDKIWNEQTVVARGLYIDTEKMKIVCRGFSKFFNINERPETKFDMLQYKLQFPVTCYVKENGFLGLVSYDEYKDDLFITTKSNPEGEYAVWLRDMIYKKFSPDTILKIKNHCKSDNVTYLFECVDMVNDPHIIEYPESELYLLAIVNNEIEFNQYDYDYIINIANNLGIKVKEKAFEIKDWSDFFDWYNEVTQYGYEYNGREIEGFVIEDSNGYMTKLKLSYYNFWKYMRAVAHETLRKGYINKTGSLDTAEANSFYAFCQKLYNSIDNKEDLDKIPKDIISLRKMFLEDK